MYGATGYPSGAQNIHQIQTGDYRSASHFECQQPLTIPTDDRKSNDRGQIHVEWDCQYVGNVNQLKQESKRSCTVSC